jgi:hypothetical protein
MLPAACPSTPVTGVLSRQKRRLRSFSLLSDEDEAASGSLLPDSCEFQDRGDAVNRDAGSLLNGAVRRDCNDSL